MQRFGYAIIPAVFALAFGHGALAQSSAPLRTLQAPATPAPVAVSLKPATTAVFVSDMTESNCRQANCTGTMVPAIKSLLERARKAGLMVVYSTNPANKWLPDVAPAASDPVIASRGQDRFFSTDLDKTLKDKGITTVVLTGWKVSGSILYTSVGATLRGYTVVVPLDASLAPNDYEEAIGPYMILNQGAANPANEPLKPKTSTLSRTDLIAFQ
jgi:isochorismate hydrolase